MSWHFSRALVSAYLGESCSDGAPSAPSSTTSTRGPSSRPGKMTAASRRSLFGTMFAPLTDDRGAAVLMSYLADFPVRTSPRPVPVAGSMASGPASGGKWPASSAKYDPVSRSWKTHQLSLDGDWELYSATLPRWGTMRAGEFWELPTPALRTNATESGSLLPTLLTPNGGRSVKHAEWVGNTAYHKGKKVQVDLRSALIRRLPTLVKRDGSRVDCPAEHRRKSPPLISVLGQLPTLTVHGNHNRKGLSPQSGDGLATALKKLPTLVASDTGCRKKPYAQVGTPLSLAVSKMPTLTAQDAKNCGGPSQMERNTPPLNALAGGPLNPEWCEWFMGCPLGWTALSALATDRLATWCVSRGMSLEDFRNE